MYKCQDCGREFPYPRKTFETHSLPHAPYEEIRLCPFCASHNFHRVEQNYCHYCGIKIKQGEDYCSHACRKKGEAAYQRQAELKERYYRNPLIVAVREVDEYNKATGKHLSYGEYFSGRR